MVSLLDRIRTELKENEEVLVISEYDYIPVAFMNSNPWDITKSSEVFGNRHKEGIMVHEVVMHVVPKKGCYTEESLREIYKSLLPFEPKSGELPRFEPGHYGWYKLFCGKLVFEEHIGRISTKMQKITSLESSIIGEVSDSEFASRLKEACGLGNKDPLNRTYQDTKKKEDAEEETLIRRIKIGLSIDPLYGILNAGYEHDGLGQPDFSFVEVECPNDRKAGRGLDIIPLYKDSYQRALKVDWSNFPKGEVPNDASSAHFLELPIDFKGEKIDPEISEIFRPFSLGTNFAGDGMMFLGDFLKHNGPTVFSELQSK